MPLDRITKFSRALWEVPTRYRSSLRYVPEWLGSLVRRTGGPMEAVFAEPRPSYTYSAIAWLEERLESDHRVFEYGTGGSSVYYAGRAGSLTAVEHDPEWHAMVVKQLEARGLDASGVALATPTEPESAAEREAYASGKNPYRALSFRNYVTAIARQPELSFDWVSVDGRARVACVREAISRVADGGYLVLDNAERDRYRAAHEMLDRFERFDFGGLGPFCTEPWLTTVWRIRH